MSYIPTPTTFKNLIELSEVFKDELVCRKYLELLLWNNEPVCPKCGHTRIYKFPDQKRFKCANNTCYKIFTVTVGTFYESTKIPLRKWFHAIYIFTSHKKGISSCQLAKDISVTQKTAWFILCRLREVLKENEFTYDLTDQIQIDETYCGGKAINRPSYVPEKAKRPGMGFTNESGLTSFIHVNNTHHTSLKKLIESKINKGSTMVTDGSVLYKYLSNDYQHRFVNHITGEYLKDGYHTNRIEGAFSHLKRGIVGIYHHASPKHLQKYCNEFAFRLSTCKQDERTRFDLALQKSVGRLKYNSLIAESEFSRYPVAVESSKQKRAKRLERKALRDAKWRS